MFSEKSDFKTNRFADKSSLMNNKSSSQKLRMTGLYGAVGFGIGRKATPVGISSNFILSNNLGASISYKYKVFKAENLPSDYTAGSNFLTGPDNSTPDDLFSFFSFNLLKEFPTKYKRIRFGIEAGPSLVKYRIAKFKREPITSILIVSSSNYSYRYENFQTVGLSLRAKMEFPFTRGFGLEAAICSNINEYKSFVALEVYLTFGYVRE
jgi:hypothetical protein